MARQGGKDVLPPVDVVDVGLALRIREQASDPKRSEIGDWRSAEYSAQRGAFQGRDRGSLPGIEAPILRLPNARSQGLFEMVQAPDHELWTVEVDVGVVHPNPSLVGQPTVGVAIHDGVMEHLGEEGRDQSVVARAARGAMSARTTGRARNRPRPAPSPAPGPPPDLWDGPRCPYIPGRRSAGPQPRT